MDKLTRFLFGLVICSLLLYALARCAIVWREYRGAQPELRELTAVRDELREENRRLALGIGAAEDPGPSAADAGETPSPDPAGGGSITRAIQ